MLFRNLLIVDDDGSQIDLFKHHVSELNKKEGIPFGFILCIAETGEDGIAALENQNIDCAVVDLRLPEIRGQRVQAKIGNRLLKKSLEENAIPHVLHTAHAGELSEEMELYKVDIIEKEGGEIPGLLELFLKKAPLINAMASIRANFRSETALLFRTAIYPQWANTTEFRRGDEDLKKVILRQIVAHLAERFSLPLENTPKHRVNEFYFVPPIRTDRLHTGDLLQLDDGTFVVVTPQCNMVSDYPEQFLLARCAELDGDIADIAIKLRGKAGDKEKAERKLRDFANQQVGISKHFLPPCRDRGPWMVDFKSVRTFASVDVANLLEKRFASIAPQFIPNLIQRFAAYIGRHGQPDLDVDELIRICHG
jgi:CheY-like chemotaxis protein